MIKMRDLLKEIFNKKINEAYDDVPLEYILTKAKKLKDYNGYTDKMEKNGLVFLHFPVNDDWEKYGVIKVFNKEDGTEVANSSYGKPKSFDDMKGTMDVRPDFRRQKIASMMYDWIEKLMKEKLVPDVPHSPSAAKFWANRIKK